MLPSQKLDEITKTPEMFDRVRKALYHLHRRQFIWAGDRQTGSHYQVLTRPDIQAFLEDYFSIEGLTLHHNTSEQWVGLVPEETMYEILPDERLKGDETLVLLMLAKTWQDGINNAEAQYRGVIKASGYEIWNEIKMITKRDLIKETRFKEVLKDFARRSLVVIGDENTENFDYEVEIRPIIQSFVTADLADRLVSFAVGKTSTLFDVGDTDEPDENEDVA